MHNYLRKHIRIFGTILLMLLSVIFYSLGWKKREWPADFPYDILPREETALTFTPDIIEILGLSGALSIFTEAELDRYQGVIEKIQYENNVRKKKRRKIEQYLVKNYHITEQEARMVVRSADVNARRHNIDLELLMAIIFVESSYQARAESRYGAIGLMQIVPKWHLDKISEYGDVDVLYDIRTNIAIGTNILMEYLKKEGNMRAALHRYNGSKNDKTLKYSNRVFQKYNELKARSYMDDARLQLNFDIISPNDQDQRFI